MGERVQPPRGTGSVGFVFGVSRAKAMPGPILTELLGRLGHSPDASRQLLARLASYGMVVRTRRGRVSVYRLAGQMLEGFHAIRLGGSSPAWPGHFHLVLYDLPEGDRQRRDRLRAAAFAAGFASWRPGVLIGWRSPQDWVAPFLRDEAAAGLIEIGTWAVDESTARRAAARAWALDGYREAISRARDQVRTVASMPSADGWGELRRLHDAFATASVLWLSVPPVPDELTPPHWPMDELGRAVADVAAQTAGAIAATLQPWLEQHPHGWLLERYPPYQWSAGAAHVPQEERGQPRPSPSATGSRAPVLPGALTFW